MLSHIELPSPFAVLTGSSKRASNTPARPAAAGRCCLVVLLAVALASCCASPLAAAEAAPEGSPAAQAGEDPASKTAKPDAESDAAPSEQAAPQPKPAAFPAAPVGASTAEQGEPGTEKETSEEEDQARGDEEESPGEWSPWFQKLFYALLVLLTLVVLIGSILLAKRLTRNWHETLWVWPVGLLLFAGFGTAVIYLIRALLGPLDPAMGSHFEKFLTGSANLWRLWLTIGLIAVPMWCGEMLSQRWRMRDYSRRIALVLFAVAAGLTITILGWPPRFGVDLSGGVTLVYEFSEIEEELGSEESDEEAAPDEDQATRTEKEDQPEKKRVQSGSPDVTGELMAAIRRRIDPGGVRQVTIRPFGERQIEIIIPREAKEKEVNRMAVERMKKKISSAGTLEFRILANRRDHEALIDEALSKQGKFVKNDEGKLQAWWVPIAGGKEDSFQYPEIATRQRDHGDQKLTEVLVYKDSFDVTGEYLVDARKGLDMQGNKVLFKFNVEGGHLFGGLTGSHLPKTGQEEFTYKLGIILDGFLHSAPRINSTIYQDGEISGGFSPQEVKDLVDILKGGRLPANLGKQPVSEKVTGPRLGRDTIERGRIAIGFSMFLVIVFMLIYYRFAGIVACLALLTNLVLILAVMISVRAAFTLPGLAGLVLTVGMAVDANVLIFERIREELDRQSTLRMAIRNGFSRATTTIVDANLTTLITAILLYAIGTDQIKGFAVTLILGVLMSMFTAIYCSRVVFDVAEKRRWITQLSMQRFLGKTAIDFLGMRRAAAILSTLLILIGLACVVGRGKGLLDIDFTGGVSVDLLFHDSHNIAKLRTELGENQGLDDLAINDVQMIGDTAPNRRFTINTTGHRDRADDVTPDEVLTDVQERLTKAFGDELIYYQMEVTLLPKGGKTPKAAEPKPEEPNTDAPKPDESGSNNTSNRLLTPASLLALANPAGALIAQVETAPETEAAKKAAAKPAPTQGKAEEPPAEPPAESPAKAPAKTPDSSPAKSTPPNETAPAPSDDVQTEAKLDFEHVIDQPGLLDRINQQILAMETAGKLPKGDAYAQVYNDEFLGGNLDVASRQWFARLNLSPRMAQTVLEAVEKELESEPYFPSSNTIGESVAGKARSTAIVALLASLICIVGYIWFRFQRVMFGLAAVVALVHDVLITLGMIALSAYLAPYLGILLVGEFKISLSVMAAFLTIVGYSLNDTIVVFDRIREVRGKAPALTGKMINTSINQTLSRTLLTSLTTLMVVVVLYVGGGEGIRTFAFALVVGVLVGTYSSIFIASPMLHWMAQGSQPDQPAQKDQPKPRLS